MKACLFLDFYGDRLFKSRIEIRFDYRPIKLYFIMAEFGLVSIVFMVFLVCFNDFKEHFLELKICPSAISLFTAYSIVSLMIILFAVAYSSIKKCNVENLH